MLELGPAIKSLFSLLSSPPGRGCLAAQAERCAEPMEAVPGGQLWHGATIRWLPVAAAVVCSAVLAQLSVCQQAEMLRSRGCSPRVLGCAGFGEGSGEVREQRPGQNEAVITARAGPWLWGELGELILAA